MNGHSTDILVVGGGLLGMLTARELAMAGARVSLLERGECGRESSWAGGGIVSPLYPWRYSGAITALASWGQRHFPALSAALLQESGTDPEWVRSGLLMLDVEDAGQARAWAAAYGHEMLLLDHDGLRNEEPALGVGESGVWMPQVGQVRNPRLVRAARDALATHGVKLREHTEVSGMWVRDGHIQGVHTASGDISAEKVIIAGGAWSTSLIPEMPVPVEVEPARGQMLLYRTEPGTIRHIVMGQGKYLIPRRDGHVLAGSTLEYVGFDKHTTDEALEELRQAAQTLFPFLAGETVVKQWAGLRPSSPQGIPYIGEHPEVAGLYVNAGHFRNGVVLGPASARLMADLVLGRPPIVDPGPFALEAAR